MCFFRFGIFTHANTLILNSKTDLKVKYCIKYTAKYLSALVHYVNLCSREPRKSVNQGKSVEENGSHNFGSRTHLMII